MAGSEGPVLPSEAAFVEDLALQRHAEELAIEPEASALDRLATTGGGVHHPSNPVEAAGDISEHREGCAPHPPIEITEEQGQQGFILGYEPVTGEPIYRPGSGVVNGTGTEEDPYVIEGWCIESPGNSQGMAACLYLPPDFKRECGTFPQDWVGAPEGGVVIEGTEAHVVVRENVIAGAAAAPQAPASHGVLADQASNVSVVDNVATLLMSGVLITGGENVDVRGNQVLATLASGIATSGANVTIADNRVVSALFGIWSWQSEGGQASVTIEANQLAEITFSGIMIEGVDGVRLADNTVESVANDYALRVEEASDLEVTGNDFQQGGVVLHGEELDHFLHDIDGTNLVVGDPLRYVSQGQDLDVAEPAGQVIVVDSTNVTVSDVEVTDAAHGVHAAYSEAIEVDGAVIEQTRFGIVLEQTDNSTVSNTSITGAYPAPGIFLDDSDDTIVRDSTVRESGIGGTVVTGALVLASSNGNILENNTLVDNEGLGIGLWGGSTGTSVVDNRADGNAFDGIYLSGTDQSLITGNTAEENGRWGIFVHDEEGASIRENTASGNTEGGIAVYETHGATVEKNNATGNGDDPIPDNGVGLLVSQAPQTSAHDNNLVDNARAGLQAASSGTVDATENWWGCPDGPEDLDCDPVESQGSQVVYDPWRTQPVHDAGAG